MREAAAHQRGMGHMLGLLHTFSTDNCLTTDYCSDTYSPECDDTLGLEKVDNYMSYLFKRNTFTYDQRERMMHVLHHGLWINELKSSVK